MDITNTSCLIGEENDDTDRRKNKKKYFLFELLNIKNSVKDELNSRFKISTACRRNNLVTHIQIDMALFAMIILPFTFFYLLSKTHVIQIKLLFTKTKDRESQIYCLNISSQTIDLNESYFLCAVNENTYRLHNVENFRSFRGFFQT